MTDVDGPVTQGAAPAPIAPGRHFDTWDVDHPTALVHLPSGLRVHVCAYSDRAGAFTRFPAGKGVRLGPRTLDGTAVNLVVAHEETELGLRFERTGPDAARLRWWTERNGEWGLRFWVVVAVEPGAYGNPAGGHPWRPVESVPGALGLRGPAGSACVLGVRPPLLSTFHSDPDALRREYEEHGYWYLESRRAEGPVAALRYNLEEMPEHCLAIGVAADAGAALARAQGALDSASGGESEPRSSALPPHTGRHGETLDPASGDESGLRSSTPPAHTGRHGEAPGPASGDESGSRSSAPPAHTGRRYGGAFDPASGDESGPRSSPSPLHTGRYDGALDAIRDVIGWNTVHDPVNRRPYTALSRNWSSAKFGGFGVWLDDVLYHALLAGTLDLTLAEENLQAAFAGRTEAGNLPCLLTGRDAWVDRSQPPIGAFVVWLLYRRWGERRLLDNAWEVLLGNHEWWWRERDGNRNGLLEYGTSPVGEGLYRGTALAARDESSMDNSPVHDEAVLIPESHTLDCEDVGLNSLLALDGEMLALIAAELGRDGEARRIEARARGLAGRIREALWDPEREVFANRLWSGRFVSSIAPTSFYPLIAGAASPAQARALLGWMEDPRRFGGRFGLPSVSRDDPAFGDNVYWRGRVWPPLNFLVYQGLRRYGFAAEAAALARCSHEMFAAPWREARHCAENYSARDGAVTDQPDTDTFYGWGALMPAMGVAEVCDVSPWDGWSIAHTGEDVRLGPLRCPPGWARVESRAGILALQVDGAPVLRTTGHGRFRHLRIEPGSIGVELPASRAAQGERPWIELPGVSAGAVTAVRLDGAATGAPDVVAGSDGVRLTLPERSGGAMLTVAWRS